MRDSIPGLSDALRKARERSGLSQVQAGKKAGVHHVSIARFELGTSTPTLRVLCRLAEAYGIEVSELLPRKK